MKIASLVKKAGTIKKAIEKAKKIVDKAPKNKKRVAVIVALGVVGGEIAGIDAVVDACFS